MPSSSFTEEITNQVQIPVQLFRKLLEVDDLTELKFTLYVFFRLSRKERDSCCIRISELYKDDAFIKSLGNNARSVSRTLDDALIKAVRRGTLLEGEIPSQRHREKILCYNTPEGHSLLDGIQKRELNPPKPNKKRADFYPPQPNIFQLYEINIGPLTPMIADALRDAEKTYQASWIEDAFRIAVERNKRNWHYIEAILRRWREGGRDDRKDQ